MRATGQLHAPLTKVVKNEVAFKGCKATEPKSIPPIFDLKVITFMSETFLMQGSAFLGTFFEAEHPLLFFFIARIENNNDLCEVLFSFAKKSAAALGF